ncbi:MAG TPA: hypothetical protein VNS58_08510 [Puia sp.]|nr:hypothetical protein [Puia sp.]
MLLIFIAESGCITGWLSILLALTGIVLLAIYSNMLRDQVNDPASFLKAARGMKKYGSFFRNRKGEIAKPFSLARTQLVIWTAVIGCSFLYLYFCRYPGTSIHFDKNILALFGISGGTMAGGILIDKSQGDRYRHQNQPSKNFFEDILSDDSGISIARFQQLMWLVISVMVFLDKLPAVAAGQFPVLDPTLLALSGVSSTVYLTMKVGENSGNTAKAAYADAYLSDGAPPAKIPTPLNPVLPGKQSQPTI